MLQYSFSNSSSCSSSSSKFKKMKPANNNQLKKKRFIPNKTKGAAEAKGAADKKQYSCVDGSSLAMRIGKEIQENLPPEFPSLVKFMLQSHVTRGFWLGLPKPFCISHLPNDDAAVTLVDKEGKESETKYLARKKGLSAGWRRFSIEHSLLPGDVLVFQLIQPCRFKVHIVRESSNSSTEMDGAITLLNLSQSAQPIATVPPEEGKGKKKRRVESRRPGRGSQQREGSMSDHCPASNLTAGGSDGEHNSSQDFGVRLAEESAVVEFSQVKDLEAFKIVVNGLVIDSEIPKDLRAKYYELCCSRKAYLHQHLTEGMNCQLIAGVISETVNIADAIRAAKRATGRRLLEAWDLTLKCFECFGLEVGFLRDRLSKLISLSGEPSEMMASKKRERAAAEEELKDIKSKISKLDGEIEAYSDEHRMEEMFKDAATAPW